MTGLRAHRPKRRDHDALLPLVNIALLLLVFFVTVGNLTTPDPTGIVPLQSRSDAPASLQGVTVSMAADGRLVVNGEPVARAAVGKRLARACRAGGHTVLLRADARTPSWEVVALLETLRARGCRRVKLLTLPSVPG